MNFTSIKLLKACLVLSILSLIINLTMLILRIILNFTGFDNGITTAQCSSSSYLQAKISSLYLTFRVDTIFAGLQFALSISLFILLLIKFLEVRKQQTSQDQQISVECPTEKIYILISIQTFLFIANAGSALSLQVDSASCDMGDTNKSLINLIVSVVGFIISLVLLILAIILSTLKNTISNDMKKYNQQVKHQEQLMFKKFQMEAKQYISSNYSQKDELRRALTKNQNQPYGSPARILQNNNRNQLQNNLNNITAQQKQLGAQPLQGRYDNGLKRNKSLIDNQRLQKQTKIRQFQRQKQLEEQMILKNTLLIQNQDNISQKFIEDHFQLKDDLYRAIQKDKDQELSPLQLNQLMMMTKAEFKLTNNNQKGFDLQKKYSNTQADVQNKYQIKIHFKKIKDYKPNQTISEIDEQKAGQKKQNDNESSKIPVKYQQPINQQIKKILKIMMLNNSPFLKQQIREQQECPISKYLEKDQKLEIIQPNSQFPEKNKKIQFSKEEIVFSKKKERIQNGQALQKNKIRQQFNQIQSILLQRLEVMGNQWVVQKRIQQTQNEPNLTTNRKRKLIQTIRSKYYQ